MRVRVQLKSNVQVGAGHSAKDPKGRTQKSEQVGKGKPICQFHGWKRASQRQGEHLEASIPV